MSGSQFDHTILATPLAGELHGHEATLDPTDYGAALDLTVFVSCYNESEYIINTLETVRAALAELAHLTYEIIVIDDRSKDNSAEIVAEYVRAHPQERILFRHNTVNRGWAQNYLDAAFMGRGRYYRVVCGDNSEPKETMVTVFGKIGAADILIPYYATSEGRSSGRMMVSGAYTSLVNLLSGFKLHYYNGLPVHLRYNVMRWHSNTRGFGFQADILCLLLEQGFSYEEIPVTAIEKKGGASTALNFRNLLSVGHTLFDILTRRIANAIYRRRAREKLD